MKYHVLPRMACGCAIVVFAFAHCGCQSTQNGGGWASAFASKPKPVNPNDRETITYSWWGQKKKPAPDVNKLKEYMARGADDSEHGRIYADHMKLGNQAFRSKRWDVARSEYEKALAARPDDADCHYRLAVVADNELRFSVADEHYEAALRQRKSDPNLMCDYGYSYMLRGDDLQAEKTLNQALAISPSHKGAMANLGSIYAKQGRYEDALAMFRRGTSEAEAQQYLAELFPQNRAPAGNAGGSAFAQNAAVGNARPTSTPERQDLSSLSPEQVRAEMDRARREGIQKRQQQAMAESQAARNDWMNETPPARSQETAPQVGQPWILGNGGSTQPPGNPAQSQAAPNGANSQLTMTNPAYGAPGAQGPINGNSGGQFPVQNGMAPVQNGMASQGSNNGPPIVVPGTNPNSDVWHGVPIQPAGGVPNQPPYSSSNVPNMGGIQNAQVASGPNIGSQFPGSATPNAPPNVTWGGNGATGRSPQPGALTNSSISQDGPSASVAAAQVGMNVGPGGLFPVVSADGSGSPDYGSTGPASQGFGFQGNGSQGFGANASPSVPNRWGGNYPGPAQSRQFPSPAPQFAPKPFLSQQTDPRLMQLDPRLGATQNPNAFNGNGESSFNPSSANPSSNGQIAWGSPSPPPSIAPPSIATQSPASDWPQIEGQPAVIQTAGSFPGQARSNTPDALESFQSEMNAGASGRGTNFGWGDSTSSPTAASGRYEGSWPPANNSIPSTPPSSNWGGAGSPPNSPPQWNGGAQRNSGPQDSYRPAASNASASSLEQYPFAPQR
jgi:Flp pilus assembly protein TadD